MSEQQPPDLDPMLSALIDAERDAPGPDDDTVDRMYGRLAAALPIAAGAIAASTAATSTTSAASAASTAATSASTSGIGLTAAGSAGATTATTLGLKGWLLTASLALAGGGGGWWLAATVTAPEMKDESGIEHPSTTRQSISEQRATKPRIVPDQALTQPVIEPPAAEQPSAEPQSAEQGTLEPAVIEPSKAAHTLSADAALSEVNPSKAPSRPSEARLLTRAIKALKQQQPEKAWRVLEHHRRLYPGGQQAEERDRLAIKTLLTLGRVSAARRRYDTFARRHPRALHLDRLGAQITAAEKNSAK
ncbi:MAG: hypothetical protein ACE366_07400 [Bradymonadia bacterium]